MHRGKQDKADHRSHLGLRPWAGLDLGYSFADAYVLVKAMGCAILFDTVQRKYRVEHNDTVLGEGGTIAAACYRAVDQAGVGRRWQVVTPQAPLPAPWTPQTRVLFEPLTGVAVRMERDLIHNALQRQWATRNGQSREVFQPLSPHGTQVALARLMKMRYDAAEKIKASPVAVS